MAAPWAQAYPQLMMAELKLPETTKVHVERLSGSLGAVVTGADLRPSAMLETAATLRKLITEHLVLFLPAQSVDEAELTTLAEQFGSLSTHPVRTLIGRPSTVSVIEDTADRPPAGFPWHTDLSWLTEPPRFGFLQALSIPEAGGDTMWASLPAAYRALSPALQRLCGELHAVHCVDQSLTDSVRRLHGHDVAEQLLEQYPAVRHPLVRRHPDTGEPSLWISPMYVDEIENLLPHESRLLLQLIEGVVVDPNRTVRWRWSPGDIAIWDEASTVHRALVDHHPSERRMRRCTTAGQRVVPFG